MSRVTRHKAKLRNAAKLAAVHTIKASDNVRAVVQQATTKTVQLGGPELAKLLMLAQLPVGPSLIQKTPSLNRNSAARRRARIEAGTLKVENGCLVGA